METPTPPSTRSAPPAPRDLMSLLAWLLVAYTVVAGVWTVVDEVRRFADRPDVLRHGLLTVAVHDVVAVVGCAVLIVAVRRGSSRGWKAAAGAYLLYRAFLSGRAVVYAATADRAPAAGWMMAWTVLAAVCLVLVAGLWRRRHESVTAPPSVSPEASSPAASRPRTRPGVVTALLLLARGMLVAVVVGGFVLAALPGSGSDPEESRALLQLMLIVIGVPVFACCVAFLVALEYAVARGSFSALALASVVMLVGLLGGMTFLGGLVLGSGMAVTVLVALGVVATFLALMWNPRTFGWLEEVRSRRIAQLSTGPSRAGAEPA